MSIHTDQNGEKFELLLPTTPELMRDYVRRADRAFAKEELFDELVEALQHMTALAQQWTRFNGQPDSTTAEIEAAKRLLLQLT